MDYEVLKTEYLCYIMNRLGLPAEGDSGYLRLCETLQDIEFLPQTDMDENRTSECRIIRRDFASAEYTYENEEFIADILDGCYGEYGTMLELLTIMSEKMEFEMSDSEYEAEKSKWFLEMLWNCGLSRNCLNIDFDTEGNEETVRDAMHTVIFHKTGWDGEGGLFPLLCPKEDQRKLELIIQMNNYLEENYDLC